MVAVNLLILTGPTLAVDDGQLQIPERVIFGVRGDAQPFSYCVPPKEAETCSGDNCPVSTGQEGCPAVAGYSVRLCREIERHIKETRPQTTFAYHEVSANSSSGRERFQLLRSGDISILCGATTVTLDRLREFRASLLTFISGASAIHPESLDIASNDDLHDQIVGVLQGTTTEQLLRRVQKPDAGAEKKFELVALPSHKLARPCLEARFPLGSKEPVEGQKGPAACPDGISVYFADREILLWMMRQGDMPSGLRVSKRFFSREPYAIFVGPDLQDLSFLVNRALARLFDQPETLDGILNQSFAQTAFSDTLETLFSIQRFIQE